MSTIVEIGFCPKEIILSFIHLGLSLFLIPLIKQLPNAEHPWFFSFVIFTFIFWEPENFIFFLLKFFNLPEPAAARSLAIPLTPRQSALFGVIERSITCELLLLKYFLPTLSLYFFVESSVIPSLSLDKFSSNSEHNIPYEVMPLILLTASFIWFLGIIVPGGAYIVKRFFFAFDAPQTTFIVSFLPISTSQTLSLSAFGCFSAFFIFATIKSSNSEVWFP